MIRRRTLLGSLASGVATLGGASMLSGAGSRRAASMAAASWSRHTDADGTTRYGPWHHGIDRVVWGDDDDLLPGDFEGELVVHPTDGAQWDGVALRTPDGREVASARRSDADGTATLNPFRDASGPFPPGVYRLVVFDVTPDESRHHRGFVRVPIVPSIEFLSLRGLEPFFLVAFQNAGRSPFFVDALAFKGVANPGSLSPTVGWENRRPTVIHPGDPVIISPRDEAFPFERADGCVLLPRRFEVRLRLVPLTVVTLRVALDESDLDPDLRGCYRFIDDR